MNCGRLMITIIINSYTSTGGSPLRRCFKAVAQAEWEHVLDKLSEPSAIRKFHQDIFLPCYKQVIKRYVKYRYLHKLSDASLLNPEPPIQPTFP